jgi:hypothetical protein
MTLKPYFEVVEAELREILLDQSDEIAAIGFDGERLIVQFHRFPGLWSAPATRLEYERLVDAEKIDAVFSAKIAELRPRMGNWYDLVPFTRRRRKKSI